VNKSEINILIIEDDKSMREAMTEVVKRKGYKPVPVARPEEAISIVKIKTIHAMIVDVMLPGTNGVDLVGRLQENLSDSTAIIFMSGIYRDRSFIQDAIKKTSALEYFTKPFNTEEMFAVIDKKLSELVEAPKVDIHALLATPFASNRERRKALDHVEHLTGYDLPFVFCILMDAESTGYLNIVDAEQNIYGVTFIKGAISKIDSESTALHTKRVLIQHGFISELELGELKNKGFAGDLIKNLVDEGLVSPHVKHVIKIETVSNELKRLINEKTININFVPDRTLTPEDENIDIDMFMPLLHDVVEKLLPTQWLKLFYSKWLGHHVRLGPQFADHLKLMTLPIFSKMSGLKELVKQELTIEELISKSPQFTDNQFYCALHLMMLRRVLVFEEVKQVRNIDEHVSRLKSMLSQIENKDPFQVFVYFGLPANPKAAEVVRIYKEFAKTYHPDTLPQSVTAEVKKLNHAVFAKVTSAYEILSNEEKKAKYLETNKQKDAEKHIKSDELVTSAATALNRGHYSEALPLLESALKLYENERSLMHYWWAKLKVDGQVTPEFVTGIETKLRGMNPDARKTALWIYLNGLIKKFKGDINGAEAEFQRTLQADEKFTDARRELAQIKASKPVKMTTEDVLTGDLSTVFKNIFKKKKGA
jgi:FixJ family two-component response regulator/tetratricopeptide (TPR) repeat protein